MLLNRMSLVERLVKQLELEHLREEELLQQTRRLAQQSAERQTLLEKLKSIESGKEKVDQLKEKLVSQNGQVRDEFVGRIADDEKQRKALSDQLADAIVQINHRLETHNAERLATLQENAKLKEQISILENNSGLSGSKLQELVKARDDEAVTLQQKLQTEIESEKALCEKLALQDTQIEEAKKVQTELKQHVDDYVQRFSQMQQCLSEANSHFSKAKQEKERFTKRIQALEGERSETMRRKERALRDQNEQAKEMEKMSVVVSTLRAQIDKIQAVTAKLAEMAKDDGCQEVHIDPT